MGGKASLSRSVAGCVKPEEVVLIGVQELMADPPRVHQHHEGSGGVWATTKECYEFIQQSVSFGDRTLETGCGVSTVVFADCGATHTAVYLDAVEGDVLRKWATHKHFDLSGVTLLPGGSDRILPSLDMGDLDVVMLDGGHAFPLPTLDWYYAGSALRKGGLLIVDDVHIPGVQRLTEFLDHDPRWPSVFNNGKFGVYKRLSGGALAENWPMQAFLPPVRATDVALMSRARSALRPARHRLAAARRTMLRSP